MLIVQYALLHIDCLQDSSLEATQSFIRVNMNSVESCPDEPFDAKLVARERNGNVWVFQKKIDKTKPSSGAFMCEHFLGDKDICDMEKMEIYDADVYVKGQDSEFYSSRSNIPHPPVDEEDLINDEL
ncbi:Hypothetical_protein [Hexamita inflata]|uniref:Hypothetical_protein n=1 Tax=Hexamita inflata TaxID=28002 RepID=A0AA86Q2T2_9EUKA|nr:Hypothetical protein HINF_LOCUS22417 [Hexamita inflata]CAI9950153.1 Hypothetical protein HINF_LOCUS37798 [Hexamita inflata]